MGYETMEAIEIRYKCEDEGYDEIKQPYFHVAESIRFAEKKRKSDFDEYVKDVNKELKNRRRSKKIEYIIKAELIQEIYQYTGVPYVLTKPIGNNSNRTQYFVHEKAEDYVFAWLLLYGGDGACEERFENSNICYQELKKKFVNRAKEKYPGQKWHYFECVLYSIINGQYEFSAKVKKTKEDGKILLPAFRQSELKKWYSSCE